MELDHQSEYIPSVQNSYYLHKAPLKLPVTSTGSPSDLTLFILPVLNRTQSLTRTLNSD